MSKPQVIAKLSEYVWWYLYDHTLIVESMAHKKIILSMIKNFLSTIKKLCIHYLIYYANYAG